MGTKAHQQYKMCARAPTDKRRKNKMVQFKFILIRIRRSIHSKKKSLRSLFRLCKKKLWKKTPKATIDRKIKSSTKCMEHFCLLTQTLCVKYWLGLRKFNSLPPRFNAFSNKYKSSNTREKKTEENIRNAQDIYCNFKGSFLENWKKMRHAEIKKWKEYISRDNEYVSIRALNIQIYTFLNFYFIWAELTVFCL